MPLQPLFYLNAKPEMRLRLVKNGTFKLITSRFKVGQRGWQNGYSREVTK